MPCVTDTGETAADGERVGREETKKKKKLTFNAALLNALTKHCKSLQCEHCFILQ